MLRITPSVFIAENEIQMEAIRAQGAGGQNVNKVASAIHLRFDIRASDLPDIYKARLLALNDQRISDDGVVVIKAQNHRTQQRNREEALERLAELVRSVTVEKKKRRPTRPSKSARQKRMDRKSQRGQTKALRGRVRGD
ncbi:MAG: alternative ribosome rescue aminoacyl-tRNA hydrolase ArfB [Alcanivoracaceae bacterium]|jgi:ribosome-associated protein|nr:alternative ribosome rescue aminoacyl-tRNA hydrolase ArfB [Alcanivoracaceae bacterium]